MNICLYEQVHVLEADTFYSPAFRFKPQGPHRDHSRLKIELLYSQLSIISVMPKVNSLTNNG